MRLFFFLLPKSVSLLVSGGHPQFIIIEIDKNKPKNISQFIFIISWYINYEIK